MLGHFYSLMELRVMSTIHMLVLIFADSIARYCACSVDKALCSDYSDEKATDEKTSQSLY